MNERIEGRIAALEAAEKETEQQLIRIRIVIAELRALLEAPNKPPITEQMHADGVGNGSESAFIAPESAVS